MRDYRREFYRVYASTHTVPRKGVLTPERLRARAQQWRTQFGPLLPGRKDARILDAGCGDGVLLWWLQDSGYTQAEGRVTWVDSQRGQFGLNTNRGTLTVAMPYQANATDANRFRNLRQNDYVRVEGQLVSNGRLDLSRFY